MSVSHLKMSALALVLSAMACGSPNEPELNAIVEVKAQFIVPTFVTNGEDRWISFSVPVTVRNLGKAELRFAYCASAVEVEVDSHWETAWTPICLAAGGPTIAVGSSRDFDIQVGAGVSGRSGPEWGGRPGARYRAAVGLVGPWTNGPIPRVSSGVFSLIEE